MPSIVVKFGTLQLLFDEQLRIDRLPKLVLVGDRPASPNKHVRRLGIGSIPRLHIDRVQRESDEPNRVGGIRLPIVTERGEREPARPRYSSLGRLPSANPIASP